MLAHLAASYAETGAECPPPEAPAWSGPDIVLIVEDDDVVASLLTLILQRGGYRSLRAHSGAECLTHFARLSGRIAVAVIDVTLPDIDGVLLGQKLRDQADTLPLLFTSGRDATGLRFRFAADARTGFLRKPFLPPDVLRAVAQLYEAAA